MLGIIPLIQSLVKVLSTAFLGLFLVNTGKEKEQLESLKEEIANVKVSKTISNGVDAMSPSRMRKLLAKPKSS